MIDKSVSIIIPCGGQHARHVMDAVGSCLRASPAPYEIVIIDDAADPPVDWAIDKPSHAIAPPHVHLYRAERHLGRSAARNYAVRKSVGAWLFFLDADDLLEPTAMEDFLRIVESEPTPDLIYADYDWLDDNGNRRRVSKRPWSRETRPPVRGAANPVNIGMFVRRDRFDLFGGFDEDMTFMEYWDLFLRYTANASVIVAKGERPFFVARSLSVVGSRAGTMAECGTLKIQAMIRGGYYRRWQTV